MDKYKALAVITECWRPGQSYVQEIIRRVRGKIVDGDFVVISEKAISVATNNIVDEKTAKPGLNAKLIARCWMRTVWGHFLGRLCHFRERMLRHLREYPLETGSRHKQVALQYSSLLQALLFGSEGGIDGSNLPFSYVSLPLRNADKIAQKIREQLWLELRKNVSVMISDTDKTYSFRNFHFTPRPRPIRGIHSRSSVLSYVVGRAFKCRRRATPLALAGSKVSVEEALEVAEVANRARGSGAGQSVWDMAERFQVGLTGVSWEMLDTVKHKPIVIVRSKR